MPGTFKLKKGLSEWKRRIKNTDISYPSLFYRIQGLTPDAYYQLEIQALNDVGWSIPNGMFIFRTSFGEIANFTRNCSLFKKHKTYLTNILAQETFNNLYSTTCQRLG